MKNPGLLILRVIVGSLLAGHGAQKMFGWFGGPGLKGTRGFMEQLGMRPGKIWGTAAAGSELTGGTLTALGLFHPVGPIMAANTMYVAIRRAHWGKPIWTMEGGAELPLTNMAACVCIAMAGPGRYSLDSLFGIRVPRWIAGLTFLGGLGMTYSALRQPDLVQKVIEKATVVKGQTSSSVSPDLEVETRPTPSEAGVTSL